jgi:hypothetical protein
LGRASTRIVTRRGSTTSEATWGGGLDMARCAVRIKLI